MDHIDKDSRPELLEGADVKMEPGVEERRREEKTEEEKRGERRGEEQKNK